MADRKLASVREIENITPIPDADRIETAWVGAWPVVVRKGQFGIGDKAVYFEVDSVLDVTMKPFAFLADDERGIKTFKMMEDDGITVTEHTGYRLRTAKLRKQLSQGLLLSLDECGVPSDTPTGTDLTDALGIVEYNPWHDDRSVRVGPFPQKYCVRSGAIRVQNLTAEWPALQGYTWYATEKIDGYATVLFMDEDGNVRVATHNQEIRFDEDNEIVIAAKKQGLLDVLHPCLAVEAEMAGPKIAKNPLELPEGRLFVYSVWDHCRPLPRSQWHETLGENSVPVLDLALPSNPEGCVAQADGLHSTVCPKRLAEGIVWHTVDASQPDCLDMRENFKAINNTYLLRRHE